MKRRQSIDGGKIASDDILGRTLTLGALQIAISGTFNAVFVLAAGQPLTKL
jgi:hypothetical protein